MTQEQQKILAQISTDTILYFLREVRCTAIQIWQPLDVIGKAKEMGFEITEEQAIDIIADIRKNKDCVIGITWDTIENHIEDLIIKNSFTLNTVESGEVKFCSLETNDEVGNYWDDDSFGYYGLTKEQILNGECESFTVKKELTKERVKEEMELHNNDEAGINNQWTYEDAEYHLLLSDEFYKN
ncbi:hypothetical protein Phi17218_144 [Cellulophaga phage phi17:2_18]|uniref:Uncharacterized protein n=2 Tax=Lightbulbvirus Cba172 TaxID=1918525 RepID=R9ZZH8_9CAUD|nr:hypothetical protein Phi17:2_gp144 [Cellulophaga phage phi17:2]AGO47677.1 hypothetical protein Phi17:2_gp144 [Cellulophaga phage phi17:2]ALO80547.1 hypothetical protein Phi17218_144 [Cellulophaga phage phi17:2_18]